MEKRIIGVTGGVGAGKSRVLKILAGDFGAHVIQADEVAKSLMEPGKECYRRVVEYLGDSILAGDGTIDRQAMAALIFGDVEKRRQVDRLTHPAVWQAIRREAETSPNRLVVIEAAILGQEFRDNCQEMWYVYTSRRTGCCAWQKTGATARKNPGRLWRARLRRRNLRRSVTAGSTTTALWRRPGGR